MWLSHLLPPGDLLKQVRGVEAGLRQRQRIGRFAQLGFLVSVALQILVVLEREGVPLALDCLVARFREQGFGDALAETARSLLDAWEYLVLFLAIGVFLLLFVWAKYRLQTPSQPFRYTCSIGALESVHDPASFPEEKAVEQWMRWLPHDLARLLNQRVQRFLFLEEDPARTQGMAKADEEGTKDPHVKEEAQDSHVHVRGHYLLRPTRDTGHPGLQVTPSVRIGPLGSAETLGEPSPVQKSFKRDDYDNLLESVYHSVVTEIYRHLQQDVKRKIELLPTKHLRAVALLNEADDYARSNALDAYEQARDLYAEAASLLKPSWKPMPQARLARGLRFARLRVAQVLDWRRRTWSRFRPKVGLREVLAARAAIGYARMLVFRRTLALMLGAQFNPVYEACSRVEQARKSLQGTGADVPGRSEALFHAYVTLALAYESLGAARPDSERFLTQAMSVDPTLAATDPVFVLVRGLVSRVESAQLGQLRRAVDLQPRFEVALFMLANVSDRLWRELPDLDPTRGALVIHEYRRVLRVNPGNLGAWANSGFVYWLLDDKEEARRCFQAGMRAKAVRSETWTAELNYGLARIYAEQGRFVRAYEHCRAAMSEMFSQDMLQSLVEFRAYYFDLIDEADRKRFELYLRRVEEELEWVRESEKAGQLDLRTAKQKGSQRVRASVHAFVLNDVGEALMGSPYIPGVIDRRHIQELFERAARLDENFALPRYNLAILAKEDATAGGEEAAKARDQERRFLEQVRALQPEWPGATLELAYTYCEHAKALSVQEEHKKEAARLLDRATEMAASLLPHEWLWRKPSERRSEQNFNWHALFRWGLEVEARWERQLNDLHVKALYAWARSLMYRHFNLPDTQEAKQRGNGGDGLRAQLLMLLQHVETHFLPMDPWLRRDMEELEPSIGSLRHLRECFQALLEGTPASVDYYVLSEVMKDRWFVVDGRRDLVIEAVRAKPQFPALRDQLSSFYKRELDRLAKRAERLAKNAEWPAGGVQEPRLGSEQQEQRTLALYKRWLALRKRKPQRSPGRREHSPAFRKRVLEKAVVLCEEGGSVLREGADLHARLARLRLEVAQGLDEEVLARAREAFQSALRIQPDNPEYAEELDMLERRWEALRREKEVEEQFGRAAREGMRGFRRVQVRLPKDLPPLLGIPPCEEAPYPDSMFSRLQNEVAFKYGNADFIPAPVFVFSAEEPPGRYTLCLDEVPLSSHELRLEGGPVAERRAAFAELIHSRLAEVYVRYLAEFIDLDVVAQMLKDESMWKDLDELKRTGGLLGLTAVIRGLVAERFSFWDFAQIVSIFHARSARGSEPLQIAEVIRSHPDLRSKNVFLASWWNYLRLGPHFCKEIREGLARGEGRVLALEPMRCKAMLEALRGWLEEVGAGSSEVLMCEPHLRPWVRKVIEASFPDLAVVSEEDVIPDYADASIGRAELGGKIQWELEENGARP